MQGRQNLINGDFFAAVKIFTRIIQTKPQNTDAYFFRGIAKFSLNDYKGAKADFKKTIQLNPFYSNAYHYLGISEDKIGNYYQAFRYYNKALNLSPYNAYIYLHKGSTYLRLKQYKKAIIQLDSSLIFNHNIPETYLNKALAYEGINDNLEALYNCNKAIDINPFMENAYLKRALLKLKRKNYEGALKDIEQSLKINNKNPLAFYYKAHILAQENKKKEALIWYNKILKLDPNNTLVLYNKAILEISLKKQAIAIDDLSNAIAINPQNILIYFARALTYYNEHQYILAQKDIETIIKIYPSFPKAYQLGKHIALQLQDIKKANSYQLKYQELIQNKQQLNTKNDSLELTSLINFNADFVDINKLEKKELQYNNANFNLLDDLFYFVRIKKQQYTILEKPKELKWHNKNYSLISYQNLQAKDINTLIQKIKNQTKDYFYYFLLGTYYGLQNDFNKATNYLTKSILLNPQFSYAYLNRAYFNTVLTEITNNVKDISTSTLSINGYPKSPQKQKTNITDYTSIKEDLEKALSLKNTIAAYNYANILALNKQYAQSLIWYEKIIKQAPEWTSPYYNKALVLLKIGDINNACTNLSKSGELGEAKAYPIMKKICK